MGLETPLNVFRRALRGYANTDIMSHQAWLPQDTYLRDLLANMLYRSVQEKDQLHQLEEANFAVGLRQIPVQKINYLTEPGVAKAISNFLNKITSGKLEPLKDQIEVNQLFAQDGHPVTIIPGDVLVMKGILLANNGQRYLVLDDDTQNQFTPFGTREQSNLIAIKMEDALNGILPLDPDNNILDATLRVARVVAIAGSLLYTAGYPAQAGAAVEAVGTYANTKIVQLLSTLSEINRGAMIEGANILRNSMQLIGFK
ncbi:hypothetical protein KBC75_03245 [Candidatus Shapirobacteria bacterium]|nr:hypothetical protein [Candidatus Shapirobacteria bacterium]